MNSEKQNEGHTPEDKLVLSEQIKRCCRHVVGGTVDLVCSGCGSKFSRQMIDKTWFTKGACSGMYWRNKFDYCDTCNQKKVKQALKKLPEIMGILANN